MVATYDLGSDVGKVRLEIPDTNIQRPIFSDAEIQYFLDTNKKDVHLAAAHALSVILGDPNRSIQWSRGSVSATKNMQEAIQNRINNLLATSGAFGSVPVKRCDWHE